MVYKAPVWKLILQQLCESKWPHFVDEETQALKEVTCPGHIAGSNSC